MNYDLDFRYRRALQPDGLATIATATQAVVDAMQDARNAGIDPARDLGVNAERRFQDYLDDLEAKGLDRDRPGMR